MSSTSKTMILAFSGLALLCAALSAVFGWRLALGAAVVAGSCAVLAALRSTADEGRALPERTEVTSVVPTLPEDSTSLESAATPTETVMPQGIEPTEVLDTLLGNARWAGTPVAAHLWLEDVGTPTLRLIACRGGHCPDPTPVSIEDGVLGAALVSGVAQCEHFNGEGDGGAGATGWRYALPLIAKEAVRGVAVVDFVGGPNPDLDQMARVVSGMRGALAGSLALHIARSELASARALLETIGDLSRLLVPSDVVRAGLNHALELSAADTGSVMLLDDVDGLEMRIAEACGLPADVVSKTRVRAGEGIAGWVLASGRPLVVEDLENKGPLSRRHGVLSAVSVPISDDGGVLGVLNIGSRRFHPRLSRTHVRALEGVARSTAIALRGARAHLVTLDLFQDSLTALALGLETRDPYSRGCTARVLDLAISIGESMGLDESDVHILKLAALLHDIGMPAAGDSVAGSDRLLTTVEWGMLKMHPKIAADILCQAPALSAVIPIVYHHHERYDGSGYTEGLAGDRIPLGSRILSLADAYVAMTSDRPHRPAMSADDALAELDAGAGSQFDPEVVGTMVSLVDSSRGDLVMRRK